MKFGTAIIIGAGAFGTSIASVLSKNFEQVILLVRSQDIYDSINRGENSIYLPGQKLASNIVAARDWTEVKAKTKSKVEIIVNGLPTAAINGFFTRINFK